MDRIRNGWSFEGLGGSRANRAATGRPSQPKQAVTDKALQGGQELLWCLRVGKRGGAESTWP